MPNRKLIDKEKFAQLLSERVDELLADNNPVVAGAVSGCIKLLFIEPEVDAVEVIRCKDCVYFDRTSPNTTTCNNLFCLRGPQEYDYCPNGKLRES